MDTVYGRYRLLRPKSALVPLDNNADLDDLFWPPRPSLEMPTRYPPYKKKTIPLKETRWSKPPQSFSSIIQGTDPQQKNKDERTDHEKRLTEIKIKKS